MLAAQTSEAPVSASLVVAAVVVFVFYFVPTVVAVARQHPNTAPIVVVNVLLGWTLVGYAVALAWAFLAIDRDRYPVRRRRSLGHQFDSGPGQTDPNNPFDFS